MSFPVLVFRPKSFILTSSLVKLVETTAALTCIQLMFKIFFRTRLPHKMHSRSEFSVWTVLKQAIGKVKIIVLLIALIFFIDLCHYIGFTINITNTLVVLKNVTACIVKVIVTLAVNINDFFYICMY